MEYIECDVRNEKLIKFIVQCPNFTNEYDNSLLELSGSDSYALWIRIRLQDDIPQVEFEIILGKGLREFKSCRGNQTASSEMIHKWVSRRNCSYSHMWFHPVTRAFFGVETGPGSYGAKPQRRQGHNEDYDDLFELDGDLDDEPEMMEEEFEYDEDDINEPSEPEEPQ